MFPVNSISLETARLARAIQVTQRRAIKAAVVGSAAVYNCRKTVGTSLWSAHAVGDAADLMFKQGTTGDERDALARAIIKDATEKTVPNLGRETKISFVIWNDGSQNLQWTRADGIQHYTGEDHSSHIHMACSYSFTSSSFQCGNKLPGVAYK